MSTASGVQPVAGERGLASWDAADLAGLVLPAWDDFLDLAADPGLDLDAPSRVDGWTAREVCVHLGSWTGTRSLDRMLEEAREGGVDEADSRAGVFDQHSHNEALLAAWGNAPRSEVLAALTAAREDVARYLASAEATALGDRPVRSVLGPLPLTTLMAAGTYELAVHALDLAPAGARPPGPELLAAGLAALVDTTGALAARMALSVRAACLSPESGWAFAAAASDWTTLRLPATPDDWPAVEGAAPDVLDVSAGRRMAAGLLARRELRLHHVTGLMSLAPIVEQVPGLPGGAALRTTVRNLRLVGNFVRRLPGLSR